MNLGSLVSETRNPQTMDLDALSTLELVNRFNQQDTLVAQAVKETLPEVAKAVDAAAEALKAGGRIIYMGAGTSGRPMRFHPRRCAIPAPVVQSGPRMIHPP